MDENQNDVSGIEILRAQVQMLSDQVEFLEAEQIKMKEMLYRVYYVLSDINSKGEDIGLKTKEQNSFSTDFSRLTDAALRLDSTTHRDNIVPTNPVAKKKRK